MGLFFQQLAFLGHDVGHNSFTTNTKYDSIVGLIVGNLCGGISMAWWKRSHNVHHVVCNSIKDDPDIQHLPYLAVSSKIFDKFWSTYHQKTFDVTSDYFARFMLSYQHISYYPLMAVARLYLFLQSWYLILSDKRVAYRELEILAELIFTIWFAYLLYSLPSHFERCMYYLVSHFIAGILHVQICLSHFSMETCKESSGFQNWVQMQVNTTLDIDCSRWMDWFHGGLQFQVEHHLFPRVPRFYLRQIQPMVKALCAKHGLEFHSSGFLKANQELVETLRTTALEARCWTSSPTSPSKHDQKPDLSLINDLLNARG